MRIAGIAVTVVVLGALGLSAGGEDIRTVVVEIEHSRFIPDRIEVEPGETVRFVVVNGDPIDHEFLIGDKKVQRAHELGTEPHHGARPGEISIAAGATEETTYTFGSATDLIFGCHLPDHYDYGMHGRFYVKNTAR